jgi:hypothetical protein
VKKTGGKHAMSANADPRTVEEATQIIADRRSRNGKQY